MLGFLLFGSLLPVVVIAVFVFLYVSTSLRDTLASQLAISAEEVRDQVDREMYDRYLDLKALADDPALAAEPAAALAAFSRGASRKYPNLSRKRFLCLAVVRADGAPLAESGACDAAGRRERAYGPRPGAAYASGTRALKDGAPVLDTYFPLAHPGSEAFGLRATEDLRPLSDLLVRQKLPGGLGKDVVIWSSENQILARKNGDPGASLAEAFPMLDKMDAPAAFAARGAIGGGRPAVAAVNTLAGLAPPLDALKWKVAVVQPLDDLSEQTLVLLQQLRRVLSLVALGAVAVSVSCWLVLFGSIIRTLNRLTEAIKRIRGGDLATTIEVERLDELGRVAQFFNEMMQKLNESLERLTELATTDPLTGLANRRAFDAKLEDEHKRAHRYGHNLSLAFLDIDNFKRSNDEHGHAFGDAVLRGVAKICRDTCRETDFVARYGGDEIVLIFPLTSKKDAAAVLERLRAAVAACAFRIDSMKESSTVTVSIGLANYPADASTEKGLAAHADGAVQAAKRGGRNRLVLATSETSPH
jgi:diguanylate cyclase (GGDEF)-like protein